MAKNLINYFGSKKLRMFAKELIVVIVNIVMIFAQNNPHLWGQTTFMSLFFLRFNRLLWSSQVYIVKIKRRPINT